MNQCNLVGDLLPLYLDGLLSEDSKQLVEAHLSRCEACAKRAKELSAPAPEPPQEADPEAEALKRTKKKFSRRTALIAGVSVALACVLVFSAVFFPVYFTAEARARRAAFEQYVMGPYYLDEPSISVESAIVVKSEEPEADGAAFTAFVEGAYSTLKIPSPAAVVQTEIPAANEWFLCSYLSETERLVTREGMHLSIEARADDTETTRLTLPALDRYDLRYDFDAAHLALSARLVERNISTYTDFADYLFSYPLGEVTESSPEKEIDAARGVRGVLRREFQVYEGRSYRYFPIRGDLTGFALFDTDTQDGTLCLQAGKGVLWSFELKRLRDDPTLLLTGEREKLESFLSKVELK